MNDDTFEKHISEMASHLLYPPMQVRNDNRRLLHTLTLRRVAIVLCIIGLSAIAIPDSRAVLVDFLQIGNVTIYLDGITENGETLRLSDVIGETNLETIQANVNFNLLLPSDVPDRVYQQANGLVIFLWLDGHDISQVFYQIANSSWGIDKSIEDLTRLEVNGHEGAWIEEAHPVAISMDAEEELTYFVTGNVLIWFDNGVTYRLETRLTQTEAINYAEALYR